MSGWIKLHRKFLDWEWFNKSEAVHLFLYMLIKANHKDAKWQGNDVKRGQFISSLGNISNATGISIQQIRTILKKLEKTNEIEVKSTSQFTIVTICKYECYQDEEETTNKPLTNNQQTTNKPSTINKNDKKERSIFKAPSLEELNAFCLENNLELNASDFLNYYDSNGWMVGKNKMKDWKATVRRWSKPKQEVIFDPLVEKARKYGYIK